MIALLGLVGIPVAYLVILGTLLVKRDPRGVGASLLFFALAAGSGLWAIFQSRSSTAGIGIIGIPFIGALCGFLGLAFGRWRSSTGPNRRVAAFLALAGAVLLVAFNIREGTHTVAKNKVRDETQAAHTAEIARNRELIAAGLKENAGRQRAWIDSSIGSRIADRAFLIAALENDSISPEILDTLATSADLGITLMVVRNPNTSGETLTKVYRRHSYPNYFFQALAGNRNTPPEILRELYTKPRTITGLDGWFARNPATPHDVLEEIATSSTSTYAISQLLQNPALDCPLFEQAARNLLARPSDSAARVLAQVEELRPQICAP